MHSIPYIVRFRNYITYKIMIQDTVGKHQSYILLIMLQWHAHDQKYVTAINSYTGSVTPSYILEWQPLPVDAVSSLHKMSINGTSCTTENGNESKSKFHCS